jgi:hypothetical protein
VRSKEPVRACRAFRDEHTQHVATYDEFKQVLEAAPLHHRAMGGSAAPRLGSRPTRRPPSATCRSTAARRRATVRCDNPAQAGVVR